MKKKKLKETYDFLQSKRKGIKKRAILFALFLLAVNTYAWFVYIAKADVKLDASVNSWDVNFYEEGSDITNDIIINIDIKPGMDDYNKKITIRNSSSVDAFFTYEIDKYTLFGTEYNLDTTLAREELLESLKTDYPFTIDISSSKDELSKDGDTLDFNISVKWPYEKDVLYYKLSSVYTYQEGINYYLLEGENYIKDETVSLENFNDKVATGLYVESDDADSYFGEQSAVFNSLNEGVSSLSFHLIMKVTQKEKTN